MLAGSTTTSLADEGSDYDLCAYTREATLDGQTPEQVGKTQVCAAVEAQPRLGINAMMRIRRRIRLWLTGHPCD